MIRAGRTVLDARTTARLIGLAVGSRTPATARLRGLRPVGDPRTRPRLFDEIQVRAAAAGDPVPAVTGPDHPDDLLDHHEAAALPGAHRPLLPHDELWCGVAGCAFPHFALAAAEAPHPAVALWRRSTLLTPPRPRTAEAGPPPDPAGDNGLWLYR
ncbi:hypothetical protein [Kitasatospora sp. DSM 101779]|uniref:hypothetical protein n=1 Tax=Kitasatospora sp. DSM 101779 TaxID=2853165 RepID=UPI0021DB7E92|nr:hypothetical protein [Kitasatospora sp. DSM 101779]MCU7826371.1 hypothetical protein [Kitasatospora sp. DSM 101779]